MPHVYKRCKADMQRTADEIWLRSFESKYSVDDKNCQMFVRILVDVIGDQKTRAEFPTFFDEWASSWGATVLFVGGAIAAIPLDMGASAAAAVFTTSLGMGTTGGLMMVASYMKEKKIKDALRKEFVE